MKYFGTPAIGDIVDALPVMVNSSIVLPQISLLEVQGLMLLLETLTVLTLLLLEKHQTHN